MSADDDDPIIEEIEVFLGPMNVRGNLFVFQHPLQTLSVAQQPIQAARIRPKQQSVELTVPLNPADDHYNPNFRAAQDADMEDESNSVVRTMKIKSSRGPMHTHYAAGLLTNGELHLNPLHGVIQLRPSLEHIDEKNAEIKANASDDDDEDDLDADALPNDAPTKVGVVIKRKETDRALAARKRSHAYVQQQKEEEPWIDLEIDDAQLRVPPNVLMSCNRHNTLIEHALSGIDYLLALKGTAAHVGGPSLVARAVVQTGNAAAVPAPVPLHVMRATMGLRDQVKTILRQANVVRFADLCGYLACQEHAVLITHLEELAVLIDGCWVVRSDVLFDDDYTSPFTKIPAENLRVGRNQLLQKFKAGESVTRDEMCSQTSLQAVDVKFMLDKTGRLVNTVNGRFRWVFKFNRDEEFLDRNPDVAARQEAQWAVLSAGFNDDVGQLRAKKSRVLNLTDGPKPGRSSKIAGGAARASRGAPALATAAAAVVATAATAVLVSTSPPSPLDAGSSANIVPEAKCIIQDLIHKRGVCRRSGLRAAVQHALPNVTDEHFESAIKQFSVVSTVAPEQTDSPASAVELDPRYIIAHSSKSAFEPMRQLVLELFRTKAVLTKKIVKASFKQQWGDGTFHHVMKEIGDETSGGSGQWVLKSGD